MKLSGSVIPRSPILLSDARRLLITLTLDEGTLDMMLGDELYDGVYDLRRHWHGFDKIAAGIEPEKNRELLADLCNTMKFGSLCALGGFTPYPVMSAMTHFPDDFQPAPVVEAAE